ncbi:MAG: NUDIX hydrolase [Acidobacteriaceae bacterium]
MRREYPDAPIAGVGAIVIDHGRVLLIKRGGPPLQGEWSIPGGAMELGETVREAVVREVFEETGLVVEAVELLGVFDRVVKDGQGKILYHYVLVDFLCRRVRGEVRASEDADDARWFSVEEVKAVPLAKDTAEVIRFGFERATT